MPTADIKMRTAEHGKVLLSLYNKLFALAGISSETSNSVSVAIGSWTFANDEGLNSAAKDLWNNKGKAIVVSGSNDVSDQVIVNGINTLLGSYESLIDLDRACNIRQGNDEEVMELLKEMNAGEVGALIIYNSNPAYTLPGGNNFTAALKKVGLTVSFADRQDETAQHCNYVCPDSHYLESWNDAEPVTGSFSTCQPTIQPLFNTRQAQQSLLIWADAPVTDYHEYLKANWEKNILNRQLTDWMKTLQAGVFETSAPAKSANAFNGNISEAAANISSRKANDVDLVLYEKTGIGNGAHANNPWLQELPDPVSRVCWDNYFAVSIEFAKQKGLSQGNVIEVKSGNTTLKGPVLIQPGSG